MSWKAKTMQICCKKPEHVLFWHFKHCIQQTWWIRTTSTVNAGPMLWFYYNVSILATKVLVIALVVYISGAMILSLLVRNTCLVTTGSHCCQIKRLHTRLSFICCYYCFTKCWMSHLLFCCIVLIPPKNAELISCLKWPILSVHASHYCVMLDMM